MTVEDGYQSAISPMVYVHINWSILKNFVNEIYCESGILSTPAAISGIAISVILLYSMKFLSARSEPYKSLGEGL